MGDVIAEYRTKLAKKGGRAKMNLPALARRDERFMSKIVADPGMCFVSKDVVSLEPTVTAEMSGDQLYRYATLDGIGKRPYYKGDLLMIDDIYLMSASRFPPTRDKLAEIVQTHKMPTGLSFADQWLEDGKNGTEVCKDYTKKAVRTFAKVACLGIGYGMGWKKFHKTAEENGSIISVAEAKATIKAYWDTFEGLKALRDTLSWEVEKKGSVTNPFGYRLTPEPHKAFNAYIQSSASGVLDVYCLKYYHMADFVRFVALIHDEAIDKVPLTRLAEAKQIHDAAVESLNSDLQWSCPIRFGFKQAANFAEIK